MRKQKSPVNLYNIRYKNSMKPIDWVYYTKFYPEKTEAIQALHLDTGLGLADAKEVVDEIFSRLERGEAEQRKANAEYSSKRYNSTYNNHQYSEINNSNEELKNDLKKVGMGIGCGCFSIIYIFFGVIFRLAGVSSGKKRRRRR